jgi:hypothetical protein
MVGGIDRKLEGFVEVIVDVGVGAVDAVVLVDVKHFSFAAAFRHA